MNSKGQYKVKSNLPVLVILSLLTLLSSCSVRKSIQARLEIPITKQLSPSKTTLTAEQLCTDAVNDLLFNQTKKTGFEPPISFLTPLLPLYLFTAGIIAQQSAFIGMSRGVSDKVPLYILYKNMKLWV